MNDRISLPELCARAAHEVNHIYNTAIGDAPSPAWDALTETQQKGIIAGAKHALEGGTPEASHELWLESRRAEGWVYGPFKDFAAKTSPNLVPYADLPEAQRRKDALFQGVVRILAVALKELA